MGGPAFLARLCGISGEKPPAIDRKAIPKDLLDLDAKFKVRCKVGAASIPCELTGEFHGNRSGNVRGYCSEENKQAWIQQHVDRLEEAARDIMENWSRFSADFMIQFSPLCGLELPPYRKLQSRIWAVQSKQYGMYEEVFKQQLDSEIAAVVEFGQAWPEGTAQELKQRCLQPEEATTLRMTYNQGLPRLPLLFRFASTLAEVIGLETPVEWSVKRPIRLWHKTISRNPVEYAQSNFRSTSDVIRVSMVFERLYQISEVLAILVTLGRNASADDRSAVLRGMGLDPYIAGEQQPGPFTGVNLTVERIRNRFVTPCLGGYRDVMVDVRINGYVCEMQLHLRSMLDLAGDRGRELHKWFKAYAREFDEYIGERTEDGVMDGSGIHWIAGGRYDGEFVDGRRHGKGVFYYVTGDRYDGDFDEDRKHGQGIYYFATGDKYRGTFANDEMTGYGTYYNYDGGRYEGEHKNGARHGWGTYIAADGTAMESWWLNNQMVAEGEGAAAIAEEEQPVPVETVPAPVETVPALDPDEYVTC